MSDTNNSNNQRLLGAYKNMIAYLHHVIDKAQGAKPEIRHALENAREKAVELGELTREEADKISDYIMRDLHDAADFIEKNRAEFKDWISLEADLIEDKILDSLPLLIDETRLALEQLQYRAETMGEWHTGEIVAPGLFSCVNCGKKLEMHSAGHIPPCAACGATVFKRVSSS
ncbi:MAG: zinc ribbon-containing protein [Gammaproteobacteria bacterium]|nr:zinc ribbon-containing protein [Gammaproteobacteria bacterium]